MSTCTQRSVRANADKCPTAGFFHLRELPICGRQMLFPVWLTDAPVVEILSWIQFRKMVDPHFSFTLDGASSFSTMPRNSGLNQAAKPKWPTGRHLVPYLGDPYWFFSFSLKKNKTKQNLSLPTIQRFLKGIKGGTRWGRSTTTQYPRAPSSGHLRPPYWECSSPQKVWERKKYTEKFKPSHEGHGNLIGPLKNCIVFTR